MLQPGLFKPCLPPALRRGPPATPAVDSRQFGGPTKRQGVRNG